MTYFWNLGRVKTGSRSRNQDNVLGFSEYLARNQKYLLQFKLESLSFQHYLMLGTIHIWLKDVVENFPCFLVRLVWWFFFFSCKLFQGSSNDTITIVNYLVNCDSLATYELLVTFVYVSMTNVLLSGLFWGKHTHTHKLWTLWSELGTEWLRQNHFQLVSCIW